MNHLFDELHLLQAEYTVRVSFLELYNEEIYDLLSPLDDSAKLTKLKYLCYPEIMSTLIHEILTIRFYFLMPLVSTSRLFEDNNRKGSVIIQGLTEVLVRNKNDVYEIMKKGSSKRTTAATLMNAQSRYVYLLQTPKLGNQCINPLSNLQSLTYSVLHHCPYQRELTGWRRALENR